MKLFPVPKQGHKFESRSIIDTQCPWCGQPLTITVRFGVINKRNGPGRRETFASGYTSPSGSHTCVDPTTPK